MTTQIIRVCSSNLNTDSLSPHTYIAKHKRHKKAYLRRLIRLVRCGHLPHDICAWLDITAKQFVDDVRQLHESGTVLSYDPRTQDEYQNFTPPSEMSKTKLQEVLDDELFYQECGLSKAQRAKLLCLTPSRFRDLQNKTQHCNEEVKIDIDLRNQSIVEVFLSAENKRGIKAEIAKAWGLSRKAIDLILVKHGINPVTTSKHKVTTERPAKKKQQIINAYSKLSAKDQLDEGMITKIAKATSSSISYVGKVIQAYQDSPNP